MTERASSRVDATATIEVGDGSPFVAAIHMATLYKAVRCSLVKVVPAFATPEIRVAPDASKTITAAAARTTTPNS
jgi:hypothetical protein